MFRITPRASQVIRAIEDALQRQLDMAVEGTDTPRTRVIFNCGDFRFHESEDDVVHVSIYHIEVMHALANDRELFLADYHYSGKVVMRKHSSSGGFVYYTTESIKLQQMDIEVRERQKKVPPAELFQTLNDIPMPV